MRHIFVAGTFNRFHAGHERLLSRALREQRDGGGMIVVGVTSDAYASKHKTVGVTPYGERCVRVADFLQSRGADSYRIESISGPELLTDLQTTKDDVLICATDTKDNAVRALEAVPEDIRPALVEIWRDPAMPSSTEMIKAEVR